MRFARANFTRSPFYFGASAPRSISQAVGSVERFVRRFPTQWFHFAPHPLREAVAEDFDVRAQRAG